MVVSARPTIRTRGRTVATSNSRTVVVVSARATIRTRAVDRQMALGFWHLEAGVARRVVARVRAAALHREDRLAALRRASQTSRTASDDTRDREATAPQRARRHRVSRDDTVRRPTLSGCSAKMVLRRDPRAAEKNDCLHVILTLRSQSLAMNWCQAERWIESFDCCVFREERLIAARSKMDCNPFAAASFQRVLEPSD